ncbi:MULTISPECIES: hypothetical protein [unclassified Moraxella]|uniref:hypothetical protein n=1 Tax=unclassified Moraxella TaxID=2685852 RepID=UPI003AF4EEDF
MPQAQNQKTIVTTPLYTKLDNFKAYAKSVAVPVTVVGFALTSQSAFADIPDIDIPFEALSDKAVDYMKKGLSAAVSVLGIGVIAVGGFKGYGLLKQGIRKA